MSHSCEAALPIASVHSTCAHLRHTVHCIHFSLLLLCLNSAPHAKQNSSLSAFGVFLHGIALPLPFPLFIDAELFCNFLLPLFEVGGDINFFSLIDFKTFLCGESIKITDPSLFLLRLEVNVPATLGIGSISATDILHGLKVDEDV